MSDPTYRDVAEWLPTDIREAIEAGTPCPVSGSHQWQHQRAEIHTTERLDPVDVIEHWRCWCGLVRTTDPTETS